MRRATRWLLFWLLLSLGALAIFVSAGGADAQAVEAEHSIRERSTIELENTDFGSYLADAQSWTVTLTERSERTQWEVIPVGRGSTAALRNTETGALLRSFAGRYVGTSRFSKRNVRAFLWTFEDNGEGGTQISNADARSSRRYLDADDTRRGLQIDLARAGATGSTWNVSKVEPSPTPTATATTPPVPATPTATATTPPVSPTPTATATPPPVSPTPTPTPTQPPMGICVVGDTCPPLRLVSELGTCIITSGGAGSTLGVQNDCSDRARAFNRTTRQVNFTDQGEMRLDGLCVVAALGETATLAACDGSPEQQWVVEASGQIRSATNGQCIDLAAGIVMGAGCAGAEQWVFLPADPDNGPHVVQAVYMTATDSVRTDRSFVMQDAVAANQARWAEDGTTWVLNSNPIVLNTSFSCAELSTLTRHRTAATRLLGEAGQFSFNTKYLIATECEDPNGVANASSTTAVFDVFILDQTEQQLQEDPSTAPDGSLSEIGVFGHELGHLFGLDHENCIIGGFQGGIDEEGETLVLGRPTTPTRGPLCNGAFYPNVDPIAPFQREIVNELSCAWIAECTENPGEPGADGRPYGCGIGGQTVFWDTTRSDLTFTLFSFDFASGVVTETPSISNTSFTPPPGTAGTKTYYAVSLSSQGESVTRQKCGSIEW